MLNRWIFSDAQFQHLISYFHKLSECFQMAFTSVYGFSKIRTRANVTTLSPPTWHLRVLLELLEVALGHGLTVTFFCQHGCGNFVRVIQAFNRTHLYVCGSGAFSPVCTYLNRGRRSEVSLTGFLCPFGC